MGARGCLRLFIVACVWPSLVLAGETSAAAPANETRVRLKGAPGAAVRRAIQGARLRLSEPSCTQMLSEFTDASGRPLQERLDGMGMSAPAYVSTVIFVEGSNQSACASGEILGGTQPGSRVVALCGAAFADTERHNARLAEAIVIHEVLHSLGLGENPPSSQEITRRVLGSCQERTKVVTRGPW